MKRKVRLTEGDLHRIIKESVKRVLREGGHLMNSYRVDIHLPNSCDDINNEYFDNKADAYRYAKEQCYGEKLQADIYCGEDWIDVVGFVDGQMNQF